SLVLFFSSRRRHTRSKRDWSSDVCSSDLRCGRWWCMARPAPAPSELTSRATTPRPAQIQANTPVTETSGHSMAAAPIATAGTARDRKSVRVGKEGRERRWQHESQNNDETE